MELDASFLEELFSKWEFTQSYRDTQKRVATMTVVNDAVDRGMKLSQVFL